MSDETYYHLVEDNNGHWYIIKVGEEENFEEWVDDKKNGRHSSFNYDYYRISGHPSMIHFTGQYIEK